MAINVECLLLLGEGSAKCPLGETQAEFAQTLLAVGSGVANAGQLAQVAQDVAGHFNRRIGRGPLPGFGDGCAALVADAAIVRRKWRRDDQRFREPLRRQVPLRNDFDRPLWRLPLQSDRCLDLRRFGLVGLGVIHALLGLREFQAQRVSTPAQQKDRRLMLAIAFRLHPGVNQRPLVVIDPQPGSVLGADDEFVNARLRGEDRTGPADGELGGVELFRVRAGGSEVEANRGIHSFQNPLAVAEAARFEVFAAQAALLISPHPALSPKRGRGWGEGGTKSLDQVGNGALVLANGEACQLNPGRSIAGLRIFGIKGLVDVSGDLFSVVTDALARVVFGHGLGDEAGELG